MPRNHPPVLNKALPLALAGLLSIVGLSVTQTPVAEAGKGRDLIAPTVSWTAPAAGAAVSGLLWEAGNSGPSGACEAAASDNVGVAKVVFSVDGVTLNTETAAPYNCKLDTTTLADGSHTLKAVAYDAAGRNASTSRTVTVANGTSSGAPTVSWKTPSSDAVVAGMLWDATGSGTSGPCEATASDAGSIAKVVFSVDGSALNTEVIAPYNCRFDTTTVADGSHTLKAVAYDDAGNASTATRTVTVSNAATPPPGDTTAPVATWTTPAAGAVVSGLLWEAANSGLSGPCETSASDNVGVTQVVFSVDGTALNTDTTAPYDCRFDTTTVADGGHTLKAVAYDAAGNTAATTRSVTVSNAAGSGGADTTAPSLSWKTPADAATVSGLLWESGASGPSGPCEVTASDAVGVSKVVFSVDGVTLNTESIAPYNCRFDTTTVPNGTHTLKAVAYDAAGNTSQSTRTVSVSNTAEPTPPPSSGTLVFEDNFDGTALNTNNWTPYNGPGHGGNGLRRPSAISVANGQLVMTATWDGTNITSGGMAHRVNYTYGTFEARVRTEADPTAQTSGIVMTWPQGDIWPKNGENDFYETGGSATRNPFYTYIHHYGATSGGQQTRIVHYASATDWHVMRMEWGPSAIKIYRDGVFIGQETNPDVIPDVPHHYSIQLDALANSALSGPVRMYVDWARVYK